MNETQLCTIEQIEQFLIGSAQIEFTTSGDDNERYAPLNRIFRRRARHGTDGAFRYGDQRIESRNITTTRDVFPGIQSRRIFTVECGHPIQWPDVHES